VPVPYFLLFLCFRKVTQEIFSELDKTKARHLDISWSFQKTEEEPKKSHWWATPPKGAAWGWPVPPYGEPHQGHF
jgi:hypothetical protein